MATIFELTGEKKLAWDEWLAERPDDIRELALRYPPNKLFWLDPPGQRVTLVSYNEDGTVMVNVSGEYNALAFERNVFGVDPKNLTECELPDDDEIVGAALTDQKDVEELIKVKLDKPCRFVKFTQ